MRVSKWGAIIAIWVAGVAVIFDGWQRAAVAEDIPSRIEHLEQELRELKRELEAQKAEQQRAAEERARAEQAASAAAPAAAHDEKTSAGGPVALLDRVKIGGYGSTRFEASDVPGQKSSFVFRRFVLTADADIAPRLKSYFELEFERFRELEIEKSTAPAGTGLRAEQEVEGTTNSEIALEQAWLQYEIEDWLKLRGGGLLVPLGRFNLNHDDNLWNLPRRSLVDRGVPVLPSTAAWDEVGFGAVGDIPLTDDALLAYQLYVMNGVALDSSIEQIAKTTGSGSGEVVYEVQLSPSTGGFAADVKDSKAVAGRLSFSPFLGHEVAGSWYYGQYTPDFLGNEDLWSLALDGVTGYGHFEAEGQLVFSRFDGTRTVATNLAHTAIDQTVESGAPGTNTEVEFELANLARSKYGYWTELRYRFWPAALKNTFLGRRFANPQFVAVLRPEQAWLDGLVEDVAFSNGELTNFQTANRRVDRFTVGFAYRPVPLVVFQLAYEYTQTNTGQGLASVTNYLPSQRDTANTVMLGTAFGF